MHRYKNNETVPCKCFYYSILNYPYEKEVSTDCDKCFSWMDIIENELNTRKKYYLKGKNSLSYNKLYRLSYDEIMEFYSN